MKTKVTSVVFSPLDTDAREAGFFSIEACTELGKFSFEEEIHGDPQITVKVNGKEIPGDSFNDFDYPDFGVPEGDVSERGEKRFLDDMKKNGAKIIDEWVKAYKNR
jgi:hypothetical protein